MNDGEHESDEEGSVPDQFEEFTRKCENFIFHLDNLLCVCYNVGARKGAEAPTRLVEKVDCYQNPPKE